MLALQGRKAEARRVVSQLEGLAKRKYVSPVNVAMVLVALGEDDKAFQWLEKAYQEHYGWLVYLGVDPRFDRVRSDPRFTDLLRRVGLLT